MRTEEDFFIQRFWNNSLQDLPMAQSVELGLPFVGFTLLDAWERSTTLRWLGSDRVEGRTLDVITFSEEAGKQTSLSFDSESGLLIREGFIRSLPPFGQEVSENVYSDYRNVDGLTVPFSAINRNAGVTWGWPSLLDLRLNPTGDESLFERPTGEQVQVLPQEVRRAVLSTYADSCPLGHFAPTTNARITGLPCPTNHAFCREFRLS